jgi:hypothetical protein
MENAIGSDKSDKYDKWEAENDLRMVTEAKKIEADPKRMANVRRAAKEKLSEMEQLKSLAAGK